MRIKIILILALMFIATPSHAYYYWLHPNGTAVYTGCRTETSTPPGDVSDTTKYCNTPSDINAYVAAGDTVYFRAGSYTGLTTGIAPSTSGEAGSVITYSGYSDEIATLTAGAWNVTAIYLYQKNYVKITKLNFTNFRKNLQILGGQYNEVSYCDLGTAYPVWEESLGAGTCTADHDVTCTHASDGTADNYWVGKGYRLWNMTDGSACMISASTATTVTCTNTGGDYVGLESVHDSGADLSWDTGDVYKITPVYEWEGSAIKYGGGINAAHNWIHHNKFYGNGAFSPAPPGADEGVVLSIGVAFSTVDSSGNNTIENNECYAGGHHVFAVNSGMYNVIRNNYFHNEAFWTDTGYWRNKGCAEEYGGKCGYRVIYSMGYQNYSGWSLWEGNRIGYGAQYGGPHADKTSGTSGGGNALATSDNIYRYNSHFANASFGLTFASSVSAPVAGNRVYNNTYYHNGWNEDSYGVVNEDDSDAGNSDVYRVAIDFRATTCSTLTNNTIKNELFYNNWAERNNYLPGTVYYPPLHVYNSTVDECNTIDWESMYFAYDSLNKYQESTPYQVEIDPLFTDPDVTDPSSSVKPDLTLQAGSTAIDQAVHLTQANGAGSSSTTLIVDDAKFFQDGTWGSSLASIEADWIAIGTVDNAAQISSINYGTNTITLTAPTTWDDDANVWMYKKSDGTRVLYGNSPDVGAHEYESTDVGEGHTIAVSATGIGCTLSHDGEYILYGDDTLNVSLSIRNGFRCTWGGTCGATGAGTQGQVYSKNPTENCTVTVVGSEKKVLKWIK